VPLVHPELGLVDIDEGLAPLITEMWAAEIDTLDCCQDVEESLAELTGQLPHLLERPAGRAQIGFHSLDDVRLFYEALANAGPRDDFYVRMVHWVAPGAWQLKAQVPCDVAVEDAMEAAVEPGQSRFEVSGWVWLAFPCTDIDEMLRRMVGHNAGRRNVAGPVDWSSVELDSGI
jgi:hypothetical protein